MIVLASTALLLALSQVATADAPSDFAIRIQYGLCWNESVDTARATFSRAIREGVVRHAKLHLASDHKRRLFDLVHSVDLFAYPPHYEPAAPMLVEPAPDYSIDVRMGGRRHVVQWVDYGSSNVEAVRLRTMLRAVRELLVALPSVQRLAASQMICL
jgi:hypothetical protein